MTETSTSHERPARGETNATQPVLNVVPSAESNGDAPEVVPRRSVSSGRSTPSQARDVIAATVGPLTDDEEEAFWKSRPVLSHIQTYALSVATEPWGALGTVIPYALSHIGPQWVLPGVIGKQASLNFYAALVGRSGAGKGSTTGAGKNAFVWPTAGAPKESKTKSGEAIVKMFMRPRSAEDSGSITSAGVSTPLTKPARTKTEWVRTHSSVFVDFPEIVTLAAIGERKGGSSIMGYLCEAWFGEHLGGEAMSKDSSMSLDAHTYRFCMTTGAQLANTSALFKHDGTGVPQRFLWMPTWPVSNYDLSHKARVRELRGSRIEPFKLTLPAEIHNASAMAALSEGRLLEFKIPERVHSELVETRAEIQYDGLRIDPLDAHILLLREKIMMALTLLDGRMEPNEEDWDLAGVVTRKSKTVRDLCIRQGEDTRKEEIQRLGADDAERSIARDTARDEKTRTAARNKIVECLKGSAGPVPLSKLPKNNRHHNPFKAEILAELAAEGAARMWEGTNDRGNKTTYIEWLVPNDDTSA